MLTQQSEGEPRPNPNITPQLPKITCHIYTAQIVQRPQREWKLLNLEAITEGSPLWQQATKEFLRTKHIEITDAMEIQMAFCKKRITNTSAAKVIHLIQHGLINKPLLNMGYRTIRNNVRFCSICEKIYITTPNAHQCKNLITSNAAQMAEIAGYPYVKTVLWAMFRGMPQQNKISYNDGMHCLKENLTVAQWQSISTATPCEKISMNMQQNT